MFFHYHLYNSANTVMKQLFFSILLFSISFAGMSQENLIKPQKVVADQWLKSWMLCGPIPLKLNSDPEKSWEHLAGFNTDYLKKSGGEKNPRIKSGDVVKFIKGSARWKYYESPDSVIDLAITLSKDAPVLAYAYNEIEAEESGLWLIGLGTNDGCRLWVNGVQVWDYQPSRGLKVDNDLIPVLLKKGTNTLLLKVEQHGNNWGFCMRFHPFSATAALERGDLFKVSSTENGISGIESSFSKVILAEIVQKLEVEVTDHQKNVVLKEERLFPFCSPLSLPSSDYQPYSASLHIILKNGETLHHDIEFTSGKRIGYSLFSRGKSDYRIVISQKASDSEHWAAWELQHWLKEIGSFEIPIYPPDQNYKGPKIVLGYNSFISEKTGAKEPDNLDESFRYFNSGPDIYIYGGKKRGTMYGVFTFLEKELGCRWYTSSVTMIPKREELKFSWYDHSEKPGIRVRNDFYFEAFDPTWAARNKMNGAMNYREQPGGTESYWAVHTFYPLMPPAEFFDKHPEYYSLIDGVRTHDRAQLCLSNPDVLRIITERIRERMRKSPEYLIYDVSQNDYYNPCQCEKCQAIVKREGNESGLIIWFVNQVAQAVEQEFPDKFIGTLAYQYTRTPPKNIAPGKNVIVRLCSIECCFAHDFRSCQQNSSFIADLQGWSAIAPHLYIWDYVVNFNHYIMPFPNFRVLQPNIKTFRENNAIGIMEQAAYQSRGGEFSELRSYLISRLLWNPDCNIDDVINDFMSGYYGRAGKFVRQYFDLLQNLVTSETHFQYGLSPFDQIYSEEFVRKSCDIFQEAEKIADNEEVLHRVEMASLPVLYLKCKRTPLIAKQDGSYAKFCEVVQREGVTHYAEQGESQRKAFHLEVENAK